MSCEAVDDDVMDMINKYSDMVYRMAYSLVKNKQDAEDIHQEVFIRYMTGTPKFQGAEHEKAWFLRVTINLCKNLWKTVWKQRVISLGEDWEAYAFVRPEDSPEGDLLQAVGALPGKYRIVIHLFYYEEMSVEEIGKLLKQKPSTVRTQLTRARGKLKAILEKGV